MSVDQTGVVDAIGVEKTSGNVVLTIFDHLPWDFDEHLLLLQEKLNAYLRFVESGELLEVYPGAEGRRVVLSVVCLYAPDQRALQFLARVEEGVETAGMGFVYRVSESG